MITKLIHKCLSVLFPIFCFGCGKENHYLCNECKEKIIPNKEELNIKYCFQVLTASNYNNPLIKKIIWNFKYKGAYILSDTIADILIMNISLLNSIKKNRDKKNFLIIPVPISKKKLRQRGYNQSDILAKSLSLKTGIPYNNQILCKKFNTLSQVKTKTKKERLFNLKNSFECKNYENQNSVIILLDDIITTGATMEETAKTLKKSGFKKIIAIAAAHG